MMLFSKFYRQAINQVNTFKQQWRLCSRLHSTKKSKPLRILFCGSDSFSVASLKAVHAECKKYPDLIKSVDVLCRPGKPFGRGLKRIREVPIKAAALELGLPVHTRDTFTGWEPPSPGGEPINLIVAVSFGLFVPPRILKTAEYGGLNVHPSILPNFRGPAPLQHTLLTGHQFTGVSLQTLDGEQVDKGVVLDQTKPWLNVPPLSTYQDLLDYITPIAAKMLVQGFHHKLHVPPLVDVGWVPPAGQQLVNATKITTENKKMPWFHPGGPATILRHHHALGRLWSNVCITPAQEKRLTFDELSEGNMNDHYSIRICDANTTVDGRNVHFIVVPIAEGERRAVFYIENELPEGSVSFLFRSAKDVWHPMTVKRITVEGEQAVIAQKALRKIRQDSWRLQPLKMDAAPFSSHMSAYPSSEFRID